MSRALLVLGGVVSALSVAAIGFAAWKMLRPPMVVLAEQVAPLPKSTVLEITTTQLSLDGTKLLDLDSLPEQRERGMKSEWKNRGPNDFAVVPLIQALETARGSRPRDSELAVKLAPDVPYRILVEALFSSGEAGYGLYRLSTSSPPLELPARKPSGGKGSHVAVFIQRDGIRVKAMDEGGGVGSNMVADCTQRGPGPAVTSNTDFAALAACLRTLRTAYDTVPVAFIAPDPEIPAWQALTVGNVLRCGAPVCATTWLGPDIYGPIEFGIYRNWPDATPPARPK